MDSSNRTLTLEAVVEANLVVVLEIGRLEVVLLDEVVLAVVVSSSEARDLAALAGGLTLLLSPPHVLNDLRLALASKLE